MKRAFLHCSYAQRLRIAALLLPALMLRALIPVGFMPSGDVASGSLLVLCHGHGAYASRAALTGADSAAHASHHHGLHGEAVAGERSDTGSMERPPPDPGPCSFAVSAAAAPPPLVADLVVPMEQLPIARHFFESLVLAQPSILRSQTSRGPPRHS